MILQQNPVDKTAYEVQSIPDFSLRLHFLIITLIYTGVFSTLKSMEGILCSEAA